MLELAIRAAREAGAILRDYAGRQFQIEHKGRINLVTEADLASERHIKELIAVQYPKHRNLGPKRAARARRMIKAGRRVITAGSLTRSTAPPTSRTAIRFTAFPSGWNAKAR